MFKGVGRVESIRRIDTHNKQCRSQGYGGKVHAVHHPHAFFAHSDSQSERGGEEEPDIKRNVIHMDKACNLRRDALRTHPAYGMCKTACYMRIATAKMRGKPVGAAGEKSLGVLRNSKVGKKGEKLSRFRAHSEFRNASGRNF